MSDEIRPVVDLSKLSWGSIKRYEALFGLRAKKEELVDCVKDHFALACYNIIKSQKQDVELYSPTTDLTCDLETFQTEFKTPDEVIESFLKIKTDDKEEQGTRKSTRFRERQERGNN
ncbi:unnamed protein product [Blepharisma stoltei]|uniref:Uncharacterized protein n=1 Tax=Blepharisma stoltei TaxID=1481888 RepID=A0AAU9J017_9CILI|nr:unnamed protein product [Blepharisma stoltei]